MIEANVLWRESAKVFSVAMLSQPVSLYACHAAARQNRPASQYILNFPLSVFIVCADDLLELFGRLALPCPGGNSSGLALFVFRQVPN